MAIAQGIRKQLVYVKEVSWGVPPAAATAVQTIRRVTGQFNLKKDTYQSEEIRTDYQMADFRHGIRSADGSLNGEFSPGTYAPFVSAALARAFSAITTTSPGSITVAGTGPSYTISRTTGSYLTDGIKIGHVVRFAGLNTNNNNKNLLVTDLTGTLLTVVVLNGTTLTLETVATGGTYSVPGRENYVPTTGHTDDSFTFEDRQADVPYYERFIGLKVNSLAVSIPANGLSTVDVAFMGKDMDRGAITPYFTGTVNAEGTTGVFAGVNGALILNGAVVGFVTSVDFTVNRNLTMEPVVGSNTNPDIFEGRCLVDGTFSAYFFDGVAPELFATETETSLVVALTTSNANNADFVTVSLPRIKVNGSDKDDGEKGIIRTYPFQALYNFAGGAAVKTQATTIQIQDSTVTTSI